MRLLLRIIPIISAEECFAVHGGTAINLFVQNLPRYSVDIDLTYIPVEPREASLAHIKDFDEIKRGFIFCLLGSDRPILESLNPNFNDQRDALTNQFEGMSSTPFTYEQYEVTRRRLVEYINDHLTPTDKAFLLGFEDGTPDWDASEYRDFQHYPSVQWKLFNIQKLKFRNQKKHEDGLRKLKTFFFGS